MTQILHQNTDLSDKILAEYQTPSEKLKKDPIMALVTRTVATYMFIKHSNNEKTNPAPEDFSSWGKPFFKNYDAQQDAQRIQTKRRARSPKPIETTKAETMTEWFLRQLATSPPIQMIRTLEKALNILIQTAPKPNKE